MQTIFVVSSTLYVIALFTVAIWCRGRIHDVEDFVVAGRKLSFPLALATLLATWFGAGTLLVTADEVAVSGLRVTVLEPYGPALCLVIAGLFYAQPLWNRKLITLQDFFGDRFGVAAERVASLYSIGYLGWLATQLVGCAGILNVFAGVPTFWGIILIAVVATVYTLLGGMWSVALTDGFQLVFVVIGIVVLTTRVLLIWNQSDINFADDALLFLPASKAEELSKWIGWLLASTVGILASQDLFQRVFSARDARIAQRACIGAGVLYAALGTLPVVVGLIATTLLDAPENGSVVARITKELFAPWVAVPFMLMVLSTVLSSLDSGLLAPSTILARNLIVPLTNGKLNELVVTRGCIVAFGVASAMLAISGESVFSMLESSYAMGAAPWLVLTAGLWTKCRHWTGVATLGLGLVAWATEMLGFTVVVPSIIWVLLLGSAIFLADLIATKLTGSEARSD